MSAAVKGACISFSTVVLPDRRPLVERGYFGVYVLIDADVRRQLG